MNDARAQSKTAPTARPIDEQLIDQWLREAIGDAEARGMPELKPMLEALGRATRVLRAADFNDSAMVFPTSERSGGVPNDSHDNQ